LRYLNLLASGWPLFFSSLAAIACRRAALALAAWTPGLAACAVVSVTR